MPSRLVRSVNDFGRDIVGVLEKCTLTGAGFQQDLDTGFSESFDYLGNQRNPVFTRSGFFGHGNAYRHNDLRMRLVVLLARGK